MVMSETGWIYSLLQRFDTGIEYLAETCPRGYLLAATVLALAGYGWLLLFPWLVLAGISAAYEALTAQPAVAWSRLLIWSTVTAGSALVTWRMARFRPTLPAGAVLDREKAAALFDLVDELGRHYHHPKIDRVVIGGEFALDLVKTPYCALPLWSMNTLVIGLPLIQGFSPTQFRCALARRLGQFSKRRNPLGNWLYQLRQVWPQYATAPGAPDPGFQPVRWFFLFFAPLYQRISLPAARLDELVADSYAMEVCSDEEMLDTISTETVCRLYLEEKYWPTYRKLTARVREIMPKPHAGMSSVLRAGLQGDKNQEWIKKAMEREPRDDDPMPSLAKRVENIGHRKPRMNAIAPDSAATVYLDTAIESLDATPGSALHAEESRASRCNPGELLQRTLIPSLVRRLRRRHATLDTPAPGNHSHITTPQ
jgi:hypothetical protein